ncbi:MAG: glycosyltransferase family 1 protein [bacterium]|nr:glycosyltransferase family 1 protein [bacterium]
MNGFKTFKVVPDVPAKLKGLYDIAYNVWLTWTPDAIKLFLRMDADLWNKTQHNPVKMLGEISQARLEELARDEGYVVEVARIRKKLQDYITNIKKRKGSSERESSIAYFSLEFGLTEALPIYSGGLGVLSGDHIKSAGDIGLNLTGIGLLYQTGYFQQYLNQDGWQQDFYKTNDFHNMPLTELKKDDGRDVEVELELPGRNIYLKVWKLSVGRITIYFMDSNIDKNSEPDRRLTAQLYGGDRELRLQQEIILGIGGVKLLDQLGISVDVIHMNEGHSSFAIFERSRLLMTTHSLTFGQAMEITRKANVFTTHTPVPAGNDEFHPDLIRKYFKEYTGRLGITMDEFLGFGRITPHNQSENFSMPVAAIRYSAYVNGVSKLHSEVAKRMWKSLWPKVPEEHIPIRAVTNGVHLPTWISFEMAELLRRYLGDRWEEKQDSKELWERVHKIPDPELWRVHSVRRRRLIYFIRKRLKKQKMDKGASGAAIAESQEALNPEALTIGFARRFATYKRGALIFSDIHRLMRILNHPERPVQLIIAGKAHPQDHAGKEVIKNIIHHITTHNLIKKITFIEDYDMNVARYMVQGVDVWLNNPLRPHEASGTSGMKASANGVLNLSVLDGWWDEAYDLSNGWAIGSGEIYDDRNYQDEVESKDIYSILENAIAPLFYDRGLEGLPRQWIKMMKNSFVSIVSYFNTQRMVKEYYDKFYREAGNNYTALSKDDFKSAKALTAWKEHTGKEFHSIKVETVNFDETKVYKIKDNIKIETEISLGNLKPGDVSVDIYYGNISPDGRLEHSEVEHLQQVTAIGTGRYMFAGHLACRGTGNFGFKIRITPAHPLIIDPYEMNRVIWQ